MQSSDRNAQNKGDDVSQLPAPTTSKKSIWGKAKETLSEVSHHASKRAAKTAEIGKQALDTGKQAYAGSTLESFVKYLDGGLEQTGAKKVIKDTSGAVVGKLDQVSGKRLIELLEQKLRVQDEYNDVLATRLAEALERIAKLEARFDEH